MQQPFRKGKQDMAQKRMQLQLEVNKLEWRLKYEKMVHQFLERVVSGRLPISIPRSLPKKVQEVLEESIVVEREIQQLEVLISRILQDMIKLQAWRSQQRQARAPALPLHPITCETNAQTHTGLEGRQVKLAMDIKSMYFLNQAMEALYGSSNFLLQDKGCETTSVAGDANGKGKRREGGSHGVVKENGGLDEMVSMADLNPRNHPTQSQSLWESESLSDANKLSEGIMKCLICIFLRLMRTSRASEQVKSSIPGRWEGRVWISDSSVGDGKASLKQTDPYGIFKLEGSLHRDIGPYKNLALCTSSLLDPRGMPSCIPLLKRLRNLLGKLQGMDLKSLSHDQKLAFWINMHNSCIMHGFLEQGLPSDPDSIIGLGTKSLMNIGGIELNATAIEQSILKNTSVVKNAYLQNEKKHREHTIRGFYGLHKREPRVIFALCYGTSSSPAVRIYTPESVSSELEKAKQEYLQASIAVTSSKKIMIPELLVPNMGDFAKDADQLLGWICNQLPVSDSLRKSMVTCMAGQKSGFSSKMGKIMPCPSAFQYLLPL